MSARVVELDGGGGDSYGGGGGGGGGGRRAQRRRPTGGDNAAAAAAAADARALPSSSAAARARLPTTWEGGPLSCTYDWTKCPNKLKVIKRVLALPLLDITAYAWLDPRRFLAEAAGAAAPPIRPRPRLFVASDDSYDSSGSGGGGGGEGGGGGGGGGGDYDLRARRQEQQRRLAAALPRRNGGANAPSSSPSLAQGAAARPWCGCGVVCRDRVFGGLVAVDPASRTLDYSKALPAPFPLGGAALVLGASWRLDGRPIVPGQPAWRPALRVGVTTALRGRGAAGGGGAADATRASATIRGSPLGSINVRQTAFLDRRLGVEFVGDVSARLRPAAAQRATAGAAALFGGGGGGAGAGGGAGGGFGVAPAGSTTIPLSPDLFDSVVVHADISEVNLVWRL